jgi:hypothetical protein
MQVVIDVPVNCGPAVVVGVFRCGPFGGVCAQQIMEAIASRRFLGHQVNAG